MANKRTVLAMDEGLHIHPDAFYRMGRVPEGEPV